MMLRTFRYPLRPTAAQAATLESWRIACQQLYNGALQERRDAWKRAKVSVSRYDQQKSLTILRRDDTSWAAIPVEVERSALARIDRAFAAFFRRMKAGEKPGFPRFKSRDRYGSIGLGRVSVHDAHVRVPTLGLIRFHEYRELRGTIRSVALRKEIDKWFVCFVCDLGAAPTKCIPQAEVGVDVGLEHFATLDTGEHIANPRFFRKGEGLLAKHQRALARKKRGSNRRKRARILVAKAYGRIRHRRVDFARKVAAGLFRRFDVVAYEDLQVARMFHGTLAKSIHDAAWALFARCLTCKAEEAGKWAIPVDPRGTSQRCSTCDVVVRKKLSDRWHRCACGTVLDRDHNAALNIRSLASAARGFDLDANPSRQARSPGRADSKG